MWITNRYRLGKKNMIKQNPMSIILISVVFWINRHKNIKIVMKWCNWHPKDCNGIHQGYTTAVLISLYSRACFYSVSIQYVCTRVQKENRCAQDLFYAPVTVTFLYNLYNWQHLVLWSKKNSWIRTESKMQIKYADPKSAHLSACIATIHTESICSQNKGHSLLKKLKSKNRGTSSNKLLVTSYILKIFKKNWKFAKHVHAIYSYTVYKLANKVN